MSYATAWFLVTIGGFQHLGPMSQQSCQLAADILQREGIVCRQPNAMTACPVPGMPATYTSCPVFDFPSVVVKEMSEP